jgi:hypothetical protein
MLNINSSSSPKKTELAQLQTPNNIFKLKEELNIKLKFI